MSTGAHLLTLEEEPGTGSVVAIGHGTTYPEVWVSDGSNIGNWYSASVPFDGHHPTWPDVVRRARERELPLVLLVGADEDAYHAGYQAGVEASIAKLDELR